jgi:hypothetical protein
VPWEAPIDMVRTAEARPGDQPGTPPDDTPAGTAAAVAGAPARAPATPGGDASGGAAAGDRRAFLRWAVGSYLVSTAAVVGGIVAYLGGHLGYVLDDPAIHLAMADRLAHHGTWGVVAGHFQSASSAPLWTALLAVAVVVAPPARDLLPVLLNVAAGVGLLWVLAGAAQPAGLAPGRRRPLDAGVVVVLVVPVLFLPGLAVVAMEHTLHTALVVAALALTQRAAIDAPGRRRDRLACVLVALAMLVRFETAFVVAGLAAGLLATDARRHTRRAAGLVTACALSGGAFALFNKAMGGGWLPNSILAKGQGTGRAGDDGLAPVDIVERLTTDPMVALLFTLAVGYLFLRGREGRALVAAWTVAVATLGHAALADVGWFERYQAYLIGLGVYLALAILAEVPAGVRSRAAAAFCVLAVVVTATKAGHLINAPRGADDMYRHQYQAARFLDRYYDGQPVATDQLGYVSLFHDGPITDFAGLGDYEALQAQSGSATGHQADWAQLTEERGFRVAVLYDVAAAGNAPRTWVAAGQFSVDGDTVTAVSQTLKFYATTPDEVAPLQQHLRDFARDLPPRVELRLNDYAPLQAARLQALQAAADGG